MPDDAGSPAVLRVRAQPRASRNAVGPVVDGVLQVRVARPPADGQANAAVRRLVADALRVAPTRLRLVAGERVRLKRFEVQGMDRAELSSRLARIGGAAD